MSLKLHAVKNPLKRRPMKSIDTSDRATVGQPFRLSSALLQISAQEQAMHSIGQATVIQLQRQCGNGCVEQLLTQAAAEKDTRFGPDILQRQEFDDEEEWDEEGEQEEGEAVESDPEQEPVENEECVQQGATLKEAFAAKAVELEAGDVDTEFKSFVEEVNGYIGNWNGAEAVFQEKDEALKASESRVVTIQEEIKRRSTEVYEEEFKAELAELQAQYEAKETERDEAKALFQSKEAELQATVQAALEQCMELIHRSEELKDYHFSIDLTMATEFAEGKEPVETMKKIEAYKQLQQELETKTKQLDERYQQNMAAYEALGEAVEAAEQDYIQKEGELVDLASQISAHEELSLESKQEELKQEEVQKEELAKEQKAAKKERAGYVKGTEFANFFSHLEAIGVGFGSSSDWDVLHNLVEQYAEACEK